MDGARNQALAGRRILIVEDELLIALELKRIVETLECEVIGPAGSNHAALDLLSTTSPDAALLDINIRGERVLPVAQECHDQDIPFAVVTGYGRLELEEPLLQSARRVRKPFDSQAIENVLSELL
jgi:DNA-binding LytR/AlgR family response regulator